MPSCFLSRSLHILALAAALGVSSGAASTADAPDLAAETTNDSPGVEKRSQGEAAPEAHRHSSIPQVDLSTPERALRYFNESVRSGDYESAARILDLSAIPASAREARGPRLSRRLGFVLDQKLWFDWEAISDEPVPSGLDPKGRYTVGTVSVGGVEIPIRMHATTTQERERVWRFAPATVASIPPLYDEYGAGWLEALPDWFFSTRFLEMDAWQWVGLLAGVVIALLISLLMAWLIRLLLARFASRTTFKWDDRLVEKSYGPLRLLFFLAVLALVVVELRLSVPAREAIFQMLVVGLVIGLTWLGVRGVAVVAWVLEQRLVMEDDKVRSRGARTQILVLRKVVSIVVLVVGSSLVLLQFEMLRTIGTSVLASAGVVGLVIGLAAQRTIGNLLAGVQLSITQPVRIDDTVIVEGEWGWIEEITLTYVVVRVWDLRRLVVPVSRFLDQTFENWTKVSPEIKGTIYLHADYAVPVDEFRGEVRRLCESSEHWDGEAASVLVTDATERTVQLRALVSAADSGALWDLRCEVREGLVAFLQSLEGGRYLPRVRLEPGLQPEGDMESERPKP